MKRKSFLGTGHKLQSVAGARAGGGGGGGGGGGRGGVKWKDHNYELQFDEIHRNTFWRIMHSPRIFLGKKVK